MFCQDYLHSILNLADCSQSKTGYTNYPQDRVLSGSSRVSAYYIHYVLFIPH
jgi:hypothetical protein